VYLYHINPDGINISGWFNLSITYDSIVEIKIISIWYVRLLLPLQSIILFGSRIWGGDAILIKFRGNILDLIIITPREPDVFLSMVKEKMSNNDPNLLAFIDQYQQRKINAT